MHSPLVQVLFDFEQRTSTDNPDNWQQFGLQFEALDASWEIADVFDLVLWMAETSSGWEGEFAYDSSLFDRATSRTSTL